MRYFRKNYSEPDLTSARLEWVTLRGGPLLLLPGELLPFWEGADEPSGGRVVEAESRWNIEPDAPATDYDRACDVEGLVGVIPVGAGQCLVFPKPMSATWWSWSPSSGMVIRGYSGHPDLLTAIAALPDADWAEEPFTLAVGSWPLYLFNSALPGSAALQQPHLKLDLNSGTYRVRTQVLDSAELGWKPLHLLARI